MLRTSQQRLKTFHVTFLDMAELIATVIHEKERGNSICSCGERIEVKEREGLVATRRVARAMKPPHTRRWPLLRTSQQRLKTFHVTFLDMAELIATVIHEKERGNSICSCGERIEVKEREGLVAMSESGGMRE